MGEQMEDPRPSPVGQQDVKTPVNDTPLPYHSSPAQTHEAFLSLPLLTRSLIASHIARGELLIIHRQLVYRIPHCWLSSHPGGDLSILHFVGRDATEEIEAFHTHSTTIQVQMARWVVGRVGETLLDGFVGQPEPALSSSLPASPSESDDPAWAKGGNGFSSAQGWKPLVPPVQLGQHVWPIDPSAPLNVDLLEPGREMLSDQLTPAYHRRLSLSFRHLRQRLVERGLYTPPDALCGYGGDLVRWTLLALASGLLFWLARTMPRTETGGLPWQGTAAYLASSAFLGMFWHQLTFLGHDAGHVGITGDYWIDRWIGVAFGAVGGLSISWWANMHNIHHVVTNSPEHDPDIQHMPIFMISTRFFDSLWSTYYRRKLWFDRPAKVLARWQHIIYYPLMFFGRFNLCALGFAFLWRHSSSPLKRLQRIRRAEDAALFVYWLWVLGLLALVEGGGFRLKAAYLLVAFGFTSPLHVQVVLSHFSQPTHITSLLESFPARQLRTTMDVDCPLWMDWFHGGLHMQVSHHLFPRIPRHRLRQVREELCDWVRTESARIDAQETARKVKKEGDVLEYKKMPFVEGNRNVLSVLREVGRQASLLSKVAKLQAVGEVPLMG